jgi:hypothetical protein
LFLKRAHPQFQLGHLRHTDDGAGNTGHCRSDGRCQLTLLEPDQGSYQLRSHVAQIANVASQRLARTRRMGP